MEKWEIITNYKPGDPAFFMRMNEVKEGVIVAIEITFKRSKENESCFISYVIKWGSNTENYAEGRVFHDKETLLKSL